MKRILFLLLIVVCVIAALWWVLHVPYRADALYRVMPVDTVLISVHRDLAGRWEDLASNPIALNLMTASGLDPQAVRKLSDSPLFQLAVRRYAGREVMWGHLPAIGGGMRSPAWTFASWLGGRSQITRWIMSMNLIRGFQKLRLPSGIVCWQLEEGSLPEPFRLYLTFGEGVVIGCMSEDVENLQYVMDAYEGRIPSLATAGARLLAATSCTDPSARDFGWVNLSAMPSRPEWTPALLRYEFSQIDPSGLGGRICVAEAMVEPESLREELDLKTVERLLGEHPMVVLAGQMTAAISLLEATTPRAWSRLLEDLLRTRGGGPVISGLLGDDDSGRYLGIKVPTLLLATRVADADGALQDMRKLVDLANTYFRLGWVPREVPGTPCRLFGIDSAVKEGFFELGLDERPAYAVCGNWLVIASNLKGLKKIVRRMDPGSASPAPPGKAWRQGLQDSEAVAYSWMDLEQAAGSLRTFLKFYSLKVLLSNPSESAELRHTLSVISAWLDALAPMGDGQLWLRGEEDGTQVEFLLGEAS